MDSDQFPIENIPFGIISTADEPTRLRPATRIHNTVIDLSALDTLGAFSDIPGYLAHSSSSPTATHPLHAPTLNAFASLHRSVRRAIRHRIQEIWTESSQAPSTNTTGSSSSRYASALLTPASRATPHLPMHTRNYTDYVSSRGHAENMADVLGHPPAARAPFYHAPMGYYGNARNVAASGAPVFRFAGLVGGQFGAVEAGKGAEAGQSRRMDFEVELGVYLCGGQGGVGRRVRVEEVEEVVFGFVVLNDWSARDIQSSESAGPTGPFLGKSGCVTVSPWVVTLDALERARLPRQMAPAVPFVDYLDDGEGAPGYGDGKPCIDIRCAATIRPSGAGATTGEPVELCRTEYRQTYWTHRQLVAHQTRNGSLVGAGDLLGTGTMSLYQSDDHGRCCLAERSYNGTKTFDVGSGQTRTWLEDGDEINLQGWVHDAKTGEKLFGFGDCRGTIVPFPE